MSLPIEESALAAQSKAEHEYGERLMDYATEYAEISGCDSVDADCIGWAVGHYPDIEIVRHAAETAGLDGRQSASFGIARLSNPEGFDLIASKLRCICAEKYGAKVSEG